MMTFNRTIVELKRWVVGYWNKLMMTFNRTIVELKQRDSRPSRQTHQRLLIEPLWN